MDAAAHAGPGRRADRPDAEAAPGLLPRRGGEPAAPPAEFRAERLGKKVAAGAQFVQTQFVFDVAAFAQWMAQVRDLGLHEQCYILPGVGAVRSRNALDYMRDKVPGVYVPDDVYRRLRAVPADQTAAEGARLAAETIQQLSAIEGVAGVHLLVAGERAGRPRHPGQRRRAGSGRSAMDVDLRPVRKLRESAAARSALGPIMEAVCASPADLGRAARGLRLDPVQAELPRGRGQQAGRGPGEHRGHRGGDRVRPAPLRGHSPGEPLRARQAGAGGAASPGLPLEPWVPGRDSCIWEFNRLYWQALTRWEEATGREYEQPCPAARATPATPRRRASSSVELFRIWDELAARHALPEELYVLELGVGNGNQARTWLDEFRRSSSRRHGREYYRRLHYLMGDYSPARARAGPAGRGRTTPNGSARWCWTPPGRPSPLGFLAVQGLPRLHLQRLRQPAHRRGGLHPRAHLPGRDAGPT